MIELSTLTMTQIIRLQNQLQQELARRFEHHLLLVFSDIVGSTPYFAHFGDAAGRQLHQLHSDLLGRCVSAAGGRIVDTAGDGAFCAFLTAEAAVRAMIDFQQAMASENAGRSHQHQLRVRVGMHWGLVLTDGVAVSGDVVNLCARVASSAEPGEIRLTPQVFRELGPADRLICHALGSVVLKGVGTAVTLLALDWRDPGLFPRRVRMVETGVVLDLPQQDIVSFGRLTEYEGVAANDIVLSHPEPELSRQISRWQFELRRTADGLRLRVVSGSDTAVDGNLVKRGGDVPVRAGTRIRVADVLTLELLGPDRPAIDDGGRTMVRLPGQPDPAA